jgi:hypothetical protein
VAFSLRLHYWQKHVSCIRFIVYHNNVYSVTEIEVWKQKEEKGAAYVRPQ